MSFMRVSYLFAADLFKAAYSTASATWLDNSEWYEASTGCVAVWVIRGKLNEDEDDPDYKRGRPTDSPGTTSVSASLVPFC